MKDNLVNCPRCEGNACYENKINNSLTTYLCYGCGFQSNSYLVSGSNYHTEQMELLPELYKDLTFIDFNNMVWIPTTINLPEKGMVFANGSSKDNWKWSAVGVKPVSEEEKTKYPIPGKKGKYYSTKTDMSTMKLFDEKDFMDALEHLSIFEL